MLLILCIMLALFILVFNYSASKNNESYDSHMLQERYFYKYIDSNSLVFVKYIGDDRCEIENGHYALITIDTTQDNKIAVGLDDGYIFYDNYGQFKCDWIIKCED